ncbi:MAG: hypothetical protein ACYS47_18720 [Planctomycetota bacterium]|jgi:hypothetical protein
MRRTLLLLPVLALLAGCAKTPIPPEVEKDYRTLVNAEFFATTYVGIGGGEPEPVTALRRIYLQDDRKKIFERLFEEANNEGKLYALSALYLLDRRSFDTRIRRLEGSRGSVKTRTGCIVQASDLDRELNNLKTGKSPKEIESQFLASLEDRRGGR